MRTHGTLSKWNDQRGFGFISPAQGTGDIFVHISAFPRDGVRPRLNELISFETETADNGKPRAVRMMRPGSTRPATASNAVRVHAPAVGLMSAVYAVLIVAVLGAFGYAHYKRSQAESLQVQAHREVQRALRPAADVAPEQSPFTCDGRRHCSQMSSCAEAKYFIRHCPNTRMDGDRDGLPCEQEWCNGRWD